MMLLSICLSLSLGGCGYRQRQAQAAFERYQAAAVAGDLPGSRAALQQLVRIDDSQASYWIELGKVNLQMSDFGAAFNAFARAHELDRANPEVLNVLTQVALRTGNLPLAEQYARQLELVSPSNPAVRLTYGYVALRRSDFAEADRQAGLILAETPYDPSGKILRARTLLGNGKADAAVALLEEQVKLQPTDEQSPRALLSIYEFRENWLDAAAMAQRLIQTTPKDTDLRARLIEAQLLSGDVGAAVPVTMDGLSNANSLEIARLLAPWTASGKGSALADPVGKLAAASEDDRRIALARFLVAIGQARVVASLMKAQATLPVTPANSAANALYATAMVASGDQAGGSARLDLVLQADNQQADALAGRATLRSAAGRHKLAIEDAQKLVAIDATVPASRLLLARIFLAAGQTDDARRTLWDAFHDLPADTSVYQTLRDLLLKTDGMQSVERLSEEYDDQRIAKMTRSFA